MAAEAPGNPFEQFVNEQLDVSSVDEDNLSAYDTLWVDAWAWKAVHPPWRDATLAAQELPVSRDSRGQWKPYAVEVGARLPRPLRPRFKRSHRLLMVGLFLYFPILIFWVIQQRLG